ncbi:MAG: NAD(+)--dinitrogen-reductase ADP-D-ribosyltransferase [Halothiobacillus sp.]|nr:NAD(+)--dinitrogen-reductase ADP-D-ribosyltransferase [Halothiobacillus sp.]
MTVETPGQQHRKPVGGRPEQGMGSNLVGLPTGLLMGADFNAFPLALHIAGTRETHAALFSALAGMTDREAAGSYFQHYMEAQFPSATTRDGDSSRRFRAQYLRLLHGWGYDSNSPEGAVLKSWVESRFGIPATFHRAVIGRYGSPAWLRYAEDKTSSRFDNNSIRLQLDLLFEFAQWFLRRFGTPGQRHLTLYRGTNDFAEHPVISRQDARHGVIRLNNLVSFTRERAIADEFGDIILEVAVPLVKVFFFNGLIPCHPLKGEAEYLVIGGDYAVRMDYY